MTENHHPDKEMLDEIERVLKHQASDNELLTKISQTIPQARSDFQNSLEESLMAQLSATTPKTESGDEFMKLYDEKSKRKKNKSSRLPFTLVAAVIAIALIGGLILITSLNNSTEPYADSLPEGMALTTTQLINEAIATGGTSTIGILEVLPATFTPTPVPDNFNLTATAIANIADERTSEDFTRVVIAIRDIELNETITADMVTTVQYDTEDAWGLAENNQGTFYYNNEGIVIGQRASTFIPAHNPITSNNVTESQNCEHEELELAHLGCSTVDFGYTLLTFNTSDAMPLVLPLGSRVDAIAALQYVDVDETSQLIVDEDDLPLDIVPTIMINTIVSNAILLNVEDSSDTITVSLALLARDADVLRYMLEANVPLRFVPHTDYSELFFDDSISSEYPLTEDGLAIVFIPLTQVNTNTIVNIGDIFDIQFSILPDETDLLSAIPTPQAGDVTNLNSLTPYSANILEINDSSVIYVGRGSEDYPNPSGDDSLFMAISVNPDDAWIVDWYASNGANFNLRPRN